MAIRPIHGLALCAGIGGLELGIKLATGDAYRCVGYVEREAFAAAVLVARMEDAALDRAPIWDDLTTFDGRPWRGRVDLVTAGYPCQPFSVAGNRAGESDPRHLWPHVRRIIAEVQPSLVFLENVPGHISLGFDTVLGEIADLGFDAEWCVLGADDVGAPHRRKRLWALAYRDPDGRELLGRSGVLDGERSACWHDADGCGGEAVADSKRASVRIESGWLGGAIGSGEAESRHDRAGVEHATREHGSEGWEPGSEATTRRLGGAGAGVGDAALSGLQGRGELADAGCLDGRRWSDGEGEERAGSAVDGCRSVWPPGPSDLHAWRAVQADAESRVRDLADGFSAFLDGGLNESNDVPPASKEALARFVRALRGNGEPSSAPPGHGHNEQRSEEHRDGLQAVPRPWTLGREASGPGFRQVVRALWRRDYEDAARRLVASSEGFPEAAVLLEALLNYGSLQPSVCRVSAGLPDRVDRLRALGNGVVPLAAAHAFRILAARVMSDVGVIETSDA